MAMKTRQGLATIAFATAELAREFLRMSRLPEKQILPLSQLGDTDHPVHATGPLPAPLLKIVFPSEEVLQAWARDKEGFESAQYVSELATSKA